MLKYNEHFKEMFYRLIGLRVNWFYGMLTLVGIFYAKIFTMDHKGTNNKTRTSQIIQNQNTPYHFSREIPQHPKQLSR